MAQIDATKVRFGTVDHWVPTTKEGRRFSGGYGWARGQGPNAGKAFLHVTDFAVARYSEPEYRLEHVSSTEVPSTLCTGDEVVLALEEPTPPKGPKAAWWASRKSWDAALQERRAHLLTRHADNGDGTVTEVQFYVDLDGTEVEVGRQVLPVREEMKYHESAHWSARAEEAENGLWLVQRQSPVYEFLRTQIRKAADLPTGSVTKFEMTRIHGEDGWVYAPHERRFKPAFVQVRPADNYNYEHAMKLVIGYGQFVVKTVGNDLDGKNVEVGLPNPARAASTEHYVHKDVWNWLEVPAELRLDFYRRYPVCKCRKARFEAAKYSACHDCRVREEYGTCPCGRVASQFNKFGERYFCGSSECGLFAVAKACALLEQTLGANSNNGEFRRIEAVVANIAAEAQRLLGGRVIVTGAEEVRNWLEAKARELIQDDGYSMDYQRRHLIQQARFDYRNSNPVAVIEAEGGYWASHASRGLLHRSAKLDEADGAEVVGLLSLLSSGYAEETRSDRRQRQQRIRVRRADGTMCRVWGKDARAARPVKREHSVPLVHLEPHGVQWLARRLERGEPVIAPRFSETESAIAEVRETVAAAEQFLARLKGQDSRRAEDFQYLTERKLEEARQALRWGEYAKARVKAQELLAECSERQAELDARRAQQDRGEVWLNVRVPISTRSQAHTKAWAILPDGSIMEPREEYSGVGRRRKLAAYQYGDLPTNVLVVRHESDTYGYRHTERWRVHYLPKVVTPEQTRVLRLVADDSRVYFAGAEANWDVRQVGSVTVTTSYGRSDHIVGEEEMYNKMTSSQPIVMEEWQVEVAERGDYDEEGVTYVVWHRPRQRMSRPATSSPTVSQNDAPRAAELAHDGRMEDAGDRYFRCLTPGCGTMERMAKSDWKEYQSGKAVPIACTGCRKTAVVVKKN